MDNPKNEMSDYARMSNCEEIQGQWIPRKGDLVARICSRDGTGVATQRSADSIVITFLGEKFADGKRRCKECKKEYEETFVSIYYERNPISSCYFEQFPSRKEEQGFFYWVKKEDLIWLPYQHQIQKIMDFESTSFLLSELSKFHKLKVGYILDMLNSMEKVWLAFYMYEKHTKAWHGEEWIRLIETHKK